MNGKQAKAARQKVKQGEVKVAKHASQVILDEIERIVSEATLRGRLKLAFRILRGKPLIKSMQGI